MFYNTIRETTDEAKASYVKAQTQQERVLAFFRRHPLGSFTPYQVHDRLRFDLASVKRCMSDLTKAGYLEKLTILVRERKGKSNHYWRLNTDRRHEQRRLFA